MKYNLLYVCFALLSLVLVSCEDGEDFPLTKLEGTYAGTFQRTVGNEPGGIAQVSITFDGNSWSGQSDTPRYPAICNGSYQIYGNIIKFENHCMFTADFDWSLILNGDFEIRQTMDAITFTKSLPNAIVPTIDRYTLKSVN